MLYMFRMPFASIIRSTINCNSSHWCLLSVVVNKHNTARVESCWFITFYRLGMHGNSNIKFLAMFATSGHITLSWAVLNQTASCHPISLRSIFLLASHLCLGLQNHLFLSPFLTKTLCEFLFFHMPATLLTHPFLLNLVTWIMCDEVYEIQSSTLCSFLKSPVTSSLISPNISLSTLFSNALSLYSSLNVRDQVSHPHKNQEKL